MTDDLKLALRFDSIGIPKTVGDIEKINAAVADMRERNEKANAVAGLLAEEYELAADEVAELTDALAAAEAQAEAIAAATREIGLDALGDFASGIKDGFVDATLASAEYQQILGGVEKRLNDTAGSAGLSIDEIVRFADALGDATLTSEEATLRASRTLLSFQNIQGETFTRTLAISRTSPRPSAATSKAD